MFQESEQAFLVRSIPGDFSVYLPNQEFPGIRGGEGGWSYSVNLWTLWVKNNCLEVLNILFKGRKKRVGREVAVRLRLTHPLSFRGGRGSGQMLGQLKRPEIGGELGSRTSPLLTSLTSPVVLG